MNTIQIEVAESAVDELLAALCAFGTPLSEHVADDVIAAAVAAVEDEQHMGDE